eukprot:5377373-Lingulodinium_polyedra.AAC.1
MTGRRPRHAGAGSQDARVETEWCCMKKETMRRTRRRESNWNPEDNGAYTLDIWILGPGKQAN